MNQLFRSFNKITIIELTLFHGKFLFFLLIKSVWNAPWLFVGQFLYRKYTAGHLDV